MTSLLKALLFIALIRFMLNDKLSISAKRNLQKIIIESEMTVILDGNDINDSYINEAFTTQPYIHAEQNKVIMKWNETINNCSYMFSAFYHNMILMK